MKPRIAIFGAGSVGCYLGGRLYGQASISLIGRPRTAATLAAHGLALSDLHGYRRQLAAGEFEFAETAAAAGGAELILVTVKSAATAEAARELAAALRRPSLLISFQNGLHNAERLRAGLPGHTVLAGMVPFNVLQRQPGAFHQGSAGTLMAEAHPALAPFLPCFHAAGLRLQLRTDMPAVQRAKLLLNLNNAINALSGLPLKEELAQRDWRRCLALAQREAWRIFAAAGLRPARLTPLPAGWLPRVLELPDPLFRRLAATMLAIDPLARSSTWEDLQAQRPTEVDELQGEIVRLAATLGRAAPVNARLLALVRAAEQARRTWTGSDLLAELRA